MSKQLALMAAVYADEERAQTILDMLQQMHKASTIVLADSAMVTKDADGKLNVTETRQLSGKEGAKRGAIVAGIFGLVFPPSLIVSALAGAGAGAAWGKLRDSGIKTGSMNELGDQLEPGKAAVIVLAEPKWVEPIERALAGYDGQIVRHAFTDTETAQLEEAATTSN
jgi:uncharacterized membrane protein